MNVRATQSRLEKKTLAEEVKGDATGNTHSRMMTRSGCSAPQVSRSVYTSETVTTQCMLTPAALAAQPPSQSQTKRIPMQSAEIYNFRTRWISISSLFTCVRTGCALPSVCVCAEQISTAAGDLSSTATSARPLSRADAKVTRHANGTAAGLCTGRHMPTCIPPPPPLNTHH